MHFLILLCDDSMHHSKDSSGIPYSYIVTVLLMPPIASKRVSLMIPLILRKRTPPPQKQDHLNRGVVPVRSCSSRQRISGCSTHPVPLLFRHAQIFDNNPTIIRTVNWWSTHSTCLDVDLNFACWGPIVPGVLSFPCGSLWTSWVTQKHVCVTWCYLHALADECQALLTEFSSIGTKL